MPKSFDQMNIEELRAHLSQSGDVRIVGDTATYAPTESKSDSAKPQKYHAQRTEYNGITYDSKAEASKAAELDLMVKAGEIAFYLRQVPFPLYVDVYRADFVTFAKRVGEELRDFGQLESLWFVKVIEVKGIPTPEWKRKFKEFKAKYPNLSIEVVK